MNLRLIDRKTQDHHFHFKVAISSMERFLLDTNIISELVRPAPNPNLTNWLIQQSSESLYISVVTVAEIMRGVAKLSSGQKKTKLTNWVRKEIPKQFNDRILSFNQNAALILGEIQGEGDRLGRPIALLDAQIASIAIQFGMTLVTRNEKDFQNLSVSMINPF